MHHLELVHACQSAPFGVISDRANTWDHTLYSITVNLAVHWIFSRRFKNEWLPSIGGGSIWAHTISLFGIILEEQLEREATFFSPRSTPRLESVFSNITGSTEISPISSSLAPSGAGSGSGGSAKRACFFSFFFHLNDGRLNERFLDAEICLFGLERWPWSCAFLCQKLRHGPFNSASKN